MATFLLSTHKTQNVSAMQQTHKQNLYFGSLTRIADLQERPFTVHRAPRNVWSTGDYVVGRYVGNSEGKGGASVDYLELHDGRLQPLKANDLVVGALGVRQATQEVVGTWKLIEESKHPEMVDICGSGMFGVETSRSIRHHLPAKFRYEGHCLHLNKKTCMKDYAPKQNAVERPECPMVLIIGSSMSCGKSLAGKAIMNIIKNDLGFKKVAGAKFTGAGYRHDIQQMLESGADYVCDFVDAGYQSTVMPPEEYREIALPTMLGLLAEQNPDCIIAELGASPLEPYCGIEALREILDSDNRPSRVFVVLCASDAYSVSGLWQALVSEGLDITPDVVCGIAANNAAGVELVKRLSGLRALNLADSASVEELRELLQKRLLD